MLRCNGLLQLLKSLWRHSGGIVKILMTELWNVAVVGESVHAHNPVGKFDGSCRGKKGADVDGHRENGETCITPFLIRSFVVEIADENLQISFKHTGSAGNEQQGKTHNDNAGHSFESRQGHEHITEKHDKDAGFNQLAVTESVGCNATEKGREVCKHQESAVKNACGSGGKPELSLQIESEDG